MSTVANELSPTPGEIRANHRELDARADRPANHRVRPAGSTDPLLEVRP